MQSGAGAIRGDRIDPARHCDYGDHVIKNLREAKANLSRLVREAAEGEEVVIAVRGKPRARLVGVDEEASAGGSREEWVRELVRAAEATAGETATAQEYWEESRADRS